MKKCYYFVAKYVKNGITRTCTGTQETIEGYFDFVSAGNFIAQENDVDYKDVIVTFWSEINSIMFDKYKFKFRKPLIRFKRLSIQSSGAD